MILNVNGHDTYCYTGGKPFNPAQPTVVFIHGVLNDHSVWILQSRYLANHGWNVLAIDLPGHCRSAGEAPASVEQAARFIGDLLQAAGVEKAALVGHSWGSLIALQAAAQLQQRVINVFSRSTLCAPPSTLGPGTWVFGGGMALGRRVLRSNPSVNVFHRGFQACDQYAGGLQAMADLSCPVLFVLGSQDQMTPPKAAQGLIQAGQAAGKAVRSVNVPVGHHQMSEAPDDTLFAIRDFLRA